MNTIVTIICTIIPIIGTAFITYFSIKKPYSQKVYELQLNSLYSPLAKIIWLYNSKDKSYETAKLFYEKIYPIIIEHLELCPHTLISAFNNVSPKILLDSNVEGNLKLIDTLITEILRQFELTKKQLGYPNTSSMLDNENLFDIILEDTVKYTLILIVIISIIAFIVYSLNASFFAVQHGYFSIFDIFAIVMNCVFISLIFAFLKSK